MTPNGGAGWLAQWLATAYEQTEELQTAAELIINSGRVRAPPCSAFVFHFVGTFCVCHGSGYQATPVCEACESAGEVCRNTGDVTFRNCLLLKQEKQRAF